MLLIPPVAHNVEEASSIAQYFGYLNATKRNETQKEDLAKIQAIVQVQKNEKANIRAETQTEGVSRVADSSIKPANLSAVGGNINILF